MSEVRVNDLSVRIGGQAGDGSLTTGDLLAKALKRMGLWVIALKDFPSRIRGGHTNYTIRAKDAPIWGPGNALDFLLAFDMESVEIHSGEIQPGGVVIYDNSRGEQVPDSLHAKGVHYLGVPLSNIARSELGLELMKNTVALGVLAELLSLDDTIFHDILASTYGRKGPTVVEKNKRAFDLGRRQAAQAPKPPYRITGNGENPKRLLITGDEAIGYGALAAGCRFLAAYPITPATDILEWMAKYLPKYNGVVIQAEDELAAINMAIGAAHAGARAMTSTSGPGFSLMTEAMALAGMVEVPVVIVDCQRPGPSTGLPTKTEQGDLNHAIFGAHGDFPRIVLSPANAEEAFYLIAEAFNLAERFQCPVIFLTEQLVAMSKQTIPPLDLSRITIDRGKLVREPVQNNEEWPFRRFAITEEGISPRPIPSVPGGMFIAKGSEHLESGAYSESPKNRTLMTLKRMRKLERAKEAVPPPVLTGDPTARVGIIGFGGTYGPILEAMEMLAKEGITTKYLRLRTLWPFPAEEIRRFVQESEIVFVVEQNATGQLRGLVERCVGPQEKVESLLKFDGQPFKPLEIATRIDALLLGPERVPARANRARR
ncbi:MAG: 2-oxoacid:acceptor oxidoreductase subunit alpha [Armatimonadota bacterium]|nr:2-oxoacid:acceptor oxidoreductase subunit alpha [Armatimonadota bacterium]MDR5702895.1 2-oxoacid:acceptor oxidoreductase subunit alpha [Armatimonadota bacterium]